MTLTWEPRLELAPALCPSWIAGPERSSTGMATPKLPPDRWRWVSLQHMRARDCALKERGRRATETFEPRPPRRGWLNVDYSRRSHRATWN
jgi:hypothetical protein